MANDILVGPNGSFANAKLIETTKFKTGDLVCLKFCGYGYGMNVIGNVASPVNGEKRVVVCWMKEDGVLCEAALPEEILVAGTESNT